MARRSDRRGSCNAGSAADMTVGEGAAALGEAGVVGESEVAPAIGKFDFTVEAWESRDAV